MFHLTKLKNKKENNPALNSLFPTKLEAACSSKKNKFIFGQQCITLCFAQFDKRLFSRMNFNASG